MVQNFRFVEEGRIALSGVPGTARAVDWLHERGIRTVVSLHPVPDEARARMAELGMVSIPCLIRDFASGVPADFAAVLDRARRAAAEEPAVLFH